jgi:hypothetical protein
VKSRIQISSMPMVARPVENSKKSGMFRSAGLAVVASATCTGSLELLDEVAKFSSNADVAMATFKTAPTRNVPWKPQSSIRNRGTMEPPTAPRTLARYRS